jgi:hypothetical protein
MYSWGIDHSLSEVQAVFAAWERRPGLARCAAGAPEPEAVGILERAGIAGRARREVEHVGVDERVAHDVEEQRRVLGRDRTVEVGLRERRDHQLIDHLDLRQRVPRREHVPGAPRVRQRDPGADEVRRNVDVATAPAAAAGRIAAAAAGRIAAAAGRITATATADAAAAAAGRVGAGLRSQRCRTVGDRAARELRDGRGRERHERYSGGGETAWQAGDAQSMTHEDPPGR